MPKGRRKLKRAMKNLEISKGSTKKYARKTARAYGKTLKKK